MALQSFLRPIQQILRKYSPVLGRNFVRKHYNLAYFWLKIKKTSPKYFVKVFLVNLAREQKSLAVPCRWLCLVLMKVIISGIHSTIIVLCLCQWISAEYSRLSIYYLKALGKGVKYFVTTMGHPYTFGQIYYAKKFIFIIFDAIRQCAWGKFWWKQTKDKNAFSNVDKHGTKIGLRLFLRNGKRVTAQVILAQIFYLLLTNSM